MNLFHTLSLLLLASLPLAEAFLKNGRPRTNKTCKGPACGEHTILTPLLREGRIGDALNASKVTLGGRISYSGFFKTDGDSEDPTEGNFMFYWYFPPKNGNTSAPTVMWLQGGPGGSSLFGLFVEMGPFYVTEDLELKEREHTWNEKYGMLFVDNPVGAGFSYTTTDTYCQDTSLCVPKNMYSLLTQFFTLHESLQSNKFYITGESYAGHYVPDIAKYIKKNQYHRGKGDPQILLHGIAIGDGWVDPIQHIEAYAPHLQALGLISFKDVADFQAASSLVTNYIFLNHKLEAFNGWDRLMNGDLSHYPSLFYNLTELKDYNNFLHTTQPEEYNYYEQYITQSHIRKAIHVGSRNFQSGEECERKMRNDVMRSTVPALAECMESMKVLIYEGQLDIIINPLGVANYMHNMMEHARTVRMGRSKPWRLENSSEIAGYIRTGRYLVPGVTYILVRNAGHILPYDQPKVAKTMIENWIENKFTL